MESTTLSVNVSSSTEGLNTTEAAVRIQTGRTLAIIYYCIGSFGLTGNAFTLTVLGSTASLRQNRTNILIMNQTTIDFLAALFLILTTAIEQEIPGNAAYCALWLTKLPLWTLLVTSTYSLMLITIEKYLAVVHDSWYERTVTDRHILICMPIIWLFCTIHCAAYAIPTSHPDANGMCNVYQYFSSLTIRYGVGLFTFIVNFLIPVVILSYCYLTLIHTLLWIEQKDVASGGFDTMSIDKVNPRHRQDMSNVVRTLVLVSVCFVSCWICNQVYFLLFNLGVSLDFQSNFYHVTVVAVFCNCCINPIVYMVQYEQFKEGARKRLCCCKKDNAVAAGVNRTSMASSKQDLYIHTNQDFQEKDPSNDTVIQHQLTPTQLSIDKI